MRTYFVEGVVGVLIGLLLVCSSCSTKEKALRTGIQMPAQYQGHASITIDSTNQTNMPSVEKWKTFFTDSNLVRLIDSGLVNNFDVQIAYQRVMQTRAGVQFTKGIRMPNLGINLSAGQRRYGDYTIDGVGNYDTKFSPNLNDKQQLPNPIPDYYAGIYSSWEIDIWGRLKNKRRAALSRFLAGEQGRNLVITNLIAEISSTYYSLMVLDQELHIIEENIKLQESALAIVEAQKETGKSNELAIELLSAQVLNAKTLLLDVKQSIIKEENTLNFLLGRYPAPIVRSSFQASTEISKIPVTGIPSDMLANRPDIKAAEYELRAQRADLKAAKAAFYPSLTLNGNLGYQSFNAALLFESPASIAYNIAGGLMLPLINRRALKADLMLSKAAQQEAYLNYEKTIVKSFIEVYQLTQQLDNYKLMQELKSEQVKVLERSVSTSKDLFAYNRASYLEIITVQQNYLSSQIEFLDINYQRTLTHIHLYKALGGGWK
ncbi:MAG: efflux system, outer rane lipoprotein NodT family [Cytophagaceae bacterium]|jgi:NodT family efflux transporter outer membrane factor (OMF) lipoprotein|nr:efflux system, outer rane lipoprotein NodT family [Cytophagaceae bacterium]